MKKIKDLARQPQFQVFFFCLGLVLFSWPLVSFSNVVEVKAMFVYLFLAWTIVALLLYLVTMSLKTANSDRD